MIHLNIANMATTHDNIRSFWAGNLKKQNAIPLYKPANCFLEPKRPAKKGTRETEKIEMNGYSAFQKIVEFRVPITNVAILRAKECQKKINEVREKRKIKLIDFEDIPVPVIQPMQKTTKVEVKKCKAINMNNKPCGYKATCGEFCKRHAAP